MLTFRNLTGDDASIVVRWRNSESAMQAFRSTQPITEAIHIEYMRSRPSTDLLWMAEYYGEPCAMFGIKVNPQDLIAEFGRLFVDELYRRHGIARDCIRFACAHAFDRCDLHALWLDVKVSNIPARHLYVTEGFRFQRGSDDKMVLLAKWWKGIE